MPISINGSGTITGLTPGGLPNATIAPENLTAGGPYWFSPMTYTFTGTLSVPPIIVLGTPIALQAGSSGGAVGDYVGKWAANNLTLSPRNSALTSFTFTDLKGVIGNFTISNLNSLTSVGISTLTTVTGNFSCESPLVLTSLSAPSLTYVGNNFVLYQLYATPTVSFPVLNIIGGDFNFRYGNISYTTMSFPAVTSVGGNFIPKDQNYITSMSFPALANIGGNFQPSDSSALSSMSFPALANIGGSFSPAFMNSITGLSFPALSYVGGAFSPAVMSGVTSLSIPNLSIVAGNFSPGLQSLTSISAPALTTVGGQFIISGISGLTSISIPAVQVLGDTTGFTNIIQLTSFTAALTTFTLPSTLLRVGAYSSGNVVITSAALNQASVDNILVRLAALNGTGGTTAFSNRTVTITGTSATPSATGLSAKSTLVARGCTVTNN